MLLHLEIVETFIKMQKILLFYGVQSGDKVH
jgi:hypothetical protein